MYSYKQTLIKGIKYFVIFLLPVLVDKWIIHYPQVAQLTIGGILVMITNLLKVQAGMKIP